MEPGKSVPVQWRICASSWGICTGVRKRCSRLGPELPWKEPWQPSSATARSWAPPMGTTEFISGARVTLFFRRVNSALSSLQFSSYAVDNSPQVSPPDAALSWVSAARCPSCPVAHPPQASLEKAESVNSNRTLLNAVFFLLAVLESSALSPLVFPPF